MISDRVWVVVGIATVVHLGADILLFSGGKGDPDVPADRALHDTSRRALLSGSLLGLVTIPWWFVPAYYLAQLPGGWGAVTSLSYVTWIGSLMAFHTAYAFIGIGVYGNIGLARDMVGPIRIVATFTLVMAAIVTVTLILVGVRGFLQLSWHHYILLPVPAMVLLQGVLGRLLRRIPYFTTAGGTLSVAAFLMSFYTVVQANSSVFAR